MAKRKKSKAKEIQRPLADAGGFLFDGLKDPALLNYMKNGADGGSSAGSITAKNAMANMALFRCVTLISSAIGMLPLNMYEYSDNKALAKEHPLFKVLKKRPNSWQTAYEFKQLMQKNVLQHGNAYARIVRSGGKVTRLIPLDPTLVDVKQKPDWSIEYKYTQSNGGKVVINEEDVFHLRDISDDGIVGISRIKLAKRVLGIAIDAEKAASRIFQSGVMAGGALSTDKVLSDKAFQNLKESLDEKKGPDNAGNWFILEEGMKADKWASTASDAQHLENRNHQIEEIARLFGVPRPFLMMDDTSWGSGMEQLAIFLVTHCLSPWFTMWEQAIERCLLNDIESDQYYVKFNEGALLRGSLKDQSLFFAKALGSGGHPAWMTQDEVRDLQELPKVIQDGTDQLKHSIKQGKQYEPDSTTED